MHCRIVWRLPVNDILALIGMQTFAYGIAGNFRRTRLSRILRFA